ncbi:MAG: 3-dehydroquinate synthase [Candidatus Omnitrophica bacterium]|nr:3-dehydroquinate synthase [Candidatus Omnitrophota bacterium]
MKRIKLDLGDRSYPIHIGSGTVEKIPGVLKRLGHAGPVVLITDETVKKKVSRLYRPVVDTLSNEVIRVVVPASEKAKSIDIFRDVSQKIAGKTRTHKPLILAIGGGVVGDLAGFVAATYRRGVPVVQVPTTLLAQVDSSIGGKVGIDLPEAKNLIGAFWQPRAVLIDTDFLSTLPVRQIRNGLGEIIKYSIIRKKRLFGYLEEHVDDILSLDPRCLEKIIYDCASIKSRVVEKDERDEFDVRIALNFGHTLGHAIESASGYSDLYNHGEAVSIGIILASEIAVRLEMLEPSELQRIKTLIIEAGLPVGIRGVSLKDILESHVYDKKFTKGSNRFLLPAAIGVVEVVEDIPELLIKTVIREYMVN